VILFTYACVLGERVKNSSDSVRSCSVRPDIYKYIQICLRRLISQYTVNHIALNYPDNGGL
jgi:hypothetical protein